MNNAQDSRRAKIRRRSAVQAFIAAVPIWGAINLIMPAHDRDSAWGFFKLLIAGFCIYFACFYLVNLIKED